MSAPLTRDEFIAKAADGILKARGFEPDSLVPGFTRVIAVEDATAALEAVGAWDLRRAVDGFRWLGNNLHNITDSPEQFRSFYEAGLLDAEKSVAVAESK